MKPDPQPTPEEVLAKVWNDHDLVLHDERDDWVACGDCDWEGADFATHCGAAALAALRDAGYTIVPTAELTALRDYRDNTGLYLRRGGCR